MKCRQAAERISALLDGELDAREEREILRHIDVCEACGQEYKKLKALEDIMAGVQLPCLPDAEWEEHWSGLYNRLERGLGFVLLGCGAIVLLIYGFMTLFETWFRDPAVPLILKIGFGALVTGIIILGISTIREKIMTRRLDRYKELIR